MAMMMQLIQQQNRPPEVNQAQKALTDQALAASNALNTGDFRTLPKNMVFNFSRPAEEKKQYEMLTNASQTGTFGLGDSASSGKANALAGMYLKDKFARDAGENFQNNVSNAAGTVQNMLSQASGAEASRINSENNRLSSLIGNISNVYGMLKSSKGPGIGSQILGTLGGILGGLKF